ncbi:MAG: hypothetical protein HYZ62_00590 [Candidatus Andersenbacteria bacterium]|nr:hypothetical protein [Candidatus Andersenbacteria bacterium]
MHGNIYCIVVHGNLVSDEIRDELFATGYYMMLSHSKKKKIKTKECEGIVRTNFQRQVFVNIGGVVFIAELETAKAKIAVTYIIRDRDLAGMAESEGGAWLSLEELGQEIPEDRLRPSPIKRLKPAHRLN